MDERFDLDIFFDWQNWNIGFALEWDGFPEKYARYRLFVVTVGPLVFFATYRL